METPTAAELISLCDSLEDKAFTLKKLIEESKLKEWQSRGCNVALQELHQKMDIISEVVCRQPKLEAVG